MDKGKGKQAELKGDGSASKVSSPAPPMNNGRDVELGARIRAARKERGLTLEALGKMAGVTRSFISQVENNVAAPSIDTLRKLANALETPVFALVDGYPSDRKVVRKQDRKRIRAPHSPVEYELLSPDMQRRMEVILMELEPRQASTPEPMGHRGEECATVLNGNVCVQIGDEYFEMEAGDTIYFDSGVPHRVTNLGKTQARIISAITPPSF